MPEAAGNFSGDSGGTGNGVASDAPVQQEALDRIYATIRQRIASKRFSLVAIPSNILSIIRLMTDPDFSYTLVSKVVEKSPVLTAEFLRIANSAVYHRGNKATNLRIVLPRLGQNTVRSALYIHSLKLGLANHPLFRDLATEIVEHSVRVANVSGHVAKYYGSDSDRAYQGGLLHDIGKLAILRELTNSKDVRTTISGPVTETCFDGILPKFHAQAGATLSGSWQLDEDIAFIIAHHHDLAIDLEDAAKPTDYVRLAAVVGFSDALTRMGERGKEQVDPEFLNHPGAIYLGVGSLERAERLYHEARRLVANAKDLA